VLWLLYLSYLILRTMVEDPRPASVDQLVLWRLHFPRRPAGLRVDLVVAHAAPQPVVFTSGGLNPEMRKIFYLSWLSLTALMILLIRQRYELEEVRAEAQILAQEAEAGVKESWQRDGGGT